MAVPIVAAEAAGAVARKRSAAKVRPYSGGSRSNVRLPHEPETAPSSATTPEAGATPSARPADGGDGAPAREPASSPSSSRGLPAPPAVVRDGAGVVLGFLVWVWVVLPYLNGGTARVKQVLAAKFINQTS